MAMCKKIDIFFGSSPLDNFPMNQIVNGIRSTGPGRTTTEEERAWYRKVREDGDRWQVQMAEEARIGELMAPADSSSASSGITSYLFASATGLSQVPSPGGPSILGIDPSSTVIGLCILDDRHYQWGRQWTVDVSKLKLPLPALTQKIVEEVVSGVGILPDLVAIEEPFVQYPRAALPIAWVCGGLAVAFGKTEVISIPHKSWKQALTGRGNADKRAVMLILKAMGYQPKDEHQASALGVALYCQSRRR